MTYTLNVTNITKSYVPCSISFVVITFLPAEGAGDAHSDVCEEGQSLGMKVKNKGFLGLPTW